MTNFPPTFHLNGETFVLFQPIVIGVLWCLITDDWPFTPVNEENDNPEEHAWSKLPNTPMRYCDRYIIIFCFIFM